jgi:hypothetical protein
VCRACAARLPGDEPQCHVQLLAYNHHGDTNTLLRAAWRCAWARVSTAGAPCVVAVAVAAPRGCPSGNIARRALSPPPPSTHTHTHTHTRVQPSTTPTFHTHAHVQHQQQHQHRHQRRSCCCCSRSTGPATRTCSTCPCTRPAASRARRSTCSRRTWA